ncbi:Hypothetical_protein [Hexamita inflata]|uniref:Hypothetical_protein n=1 Tax=Hexamita inflata TaxID=28002 RepID=A0AA86NGM7_9EUKA|nr:Hypothetical protein HINF_LOCUS6521 [Hexamita inflata]
MQCDFCTQSFSSYSPLKRIYTENIQFIQNTFDHYYTLFIITEKVTDSINKVLQYSQSNANIHKTQHIFGIFDIRNAQFKKGGEQVQQLDLQVSVTLESETSAIYLLQQYLDFVLIFQNRLILCGADATYICYFSPVFIISLLVLLLRCWFTLSDFF